jgi:V/A-type H+/Na+-transporting ATPase subunit G/H
MLINLLRRRIRSRSSITGRRSSRMTGLRVPRTGPGSEMEDHLIRLLEAEARAQGIIDASKAERQRIIDDALATVRNGEERFEAGRADLRNPFLREAHGRAEHAVAELTLKFGERQRNLREMAFRHEDEAIRAALNLLANPDR